MQARQALLRGGDGARAIPIGLALLAAVALALLPFLRQAPNRLLLGRPVGFITAAGMAGTGPVLAFGAAVLLLLLPSLFPARPGARWLSLLGAGLTLAAAAWLAGRAADSFAATASSPAARTSFAAGYWIVTAALLLMASDTARRLRLSVWGAPAAALLLLAPIAALLAGGELSQLSLLREYAAQRDLFAATLLRHILLVALALAITVVIGIPLGIAAQRSAGLRRVAFPVLNVIQTIPSIALFGLLIGPLSNLAMAVPQLAALGIGGVGIAPAVIALVLYSLLPMVRNTVEGLEGVPRQVTEAARGMGMTRGQAFWQVSGPLALPVLLSGLRVTAVQAVGLAAVSALIGAGGLGAIMFQGLFANALDLVLLGALPVIMLAVLVDMIFRMLVRLAHAFLGNAGLGSAGA
jgi:osmoprotectant transport system permease protein